MPKNTKPTQKEIDLYALGLPEEIAIELIPSVEDRTPQLVEKRTKQKILLGAFVNNGGQIIEACNETGIKYDTVKTWRRRDPIFSEAYEEARMDTLAIIENEAVRRAIRGVKQDVYYKGQVVGSFYNYSDNLIMILLKKLDPSYRDNYTQSNQFGIMGKEFQFYFATPEQETKKLEAK